MPIREHLDPPTIFGTRGEVLSLILSSQDPNYTNVDVDLELPQTQPPFKQQVATSTYCLPQINQLGALVEGDSAAVFEFSALEFRCSIYEYTRGARYAYIVEGTISTINDLDFAPWPRERTIGDYLLDGDQTAACLTFAYQCEYERLRVFYNQLSRALQTL